MGVVLCLVELSNTILSHIGLTSNTSDKPIQFLSTESSPCPKITLLSLGTRQRRMVRRAVDSSLWHLQYAWKAKSSHLARADFFAFPKYTECVRRSLLLFIFDLKPLTTTWIHMRVFLRQGQPSTEPETLQCWRNGTGSLPFCTGRQ